MINKTRLYFLVFVCLIAGYIWFTYSLFSQNNNSNNNVIHLCIIKSLTDIPCPSCGSTRSVIEIYKGNFTQALLVNPLGYLIVLFMVTLPIWVSFDIITEKSSFYNFYIKSEKIISRTYFAIFLIILILLNWCWNIYKGL